MKARDDMGAAVHFMDSWPWGKYGEQRVSECFIYCHFLWFMGRLLFLFLTFKEGNNLSSSWKLHVLRLINLSAMGESCFGTHINIRVKIRLDFGSCDCTFKYIYWHWSCPSTSKKSYKAFLRTWPGYHSWLPMYLLTAGHHLVFDASLWRALYVLSGRKQLSGTDLSDPAYM